MLLQVENRAMVSWCLWLGFGASPVAADGDMGAAAAMGHLGTVCGCALPGADPVHPCAHTGPSAGLTRRAPRTLPTCLCLSFATELLGPQFSPINVQFLEVLLQPVWGRHGWQRQSPHRGLATVLVLAGSPAGRGWMCCSGAELWAAGARLGFADAPRRALAVGLQRRSRCRGTHTHTHTPAH